MLFDDMRAKALLERESKRNSLIAQLVHLDNYKEQLQAQLHSIEERQVTTPIYEIDQRHRSAHLLLL
jgi:hypothetical protein